MLEKRSKLQEIPRLLAGFLPYRSGDKTLRLWEVKTGRCVRTFEGHTNPVRSVALSADGRWALSGSSGGTLRLWALVWEVEERQHAKWDNGARPHLEAFLWNCTPYKAELPAESTFSEELIQEALTRSGTPSWDEEQFKALLHMLGCAGYGWLRPEGVRRKLEKIAANWPPAASPIADLFVSPLRRLFSGKS